MRIACGAALAAILLSAPAAAADGIDIMRGDGANSCTASDPNGFSLSNGGLSVGIEQKHYMLVFMMSLMDDQVPAGDYPATLTLDAQPPISIEAHGEGGVYVTSLSGAQWLALRSVRKVTLNVRGKDYEFDAARLAEVMDGAARCAGVPTIPALEAIKASLAGNHSKWVVLPGDKDDLACHGTRLGKEADTFASLHPDGRLYFGPAGHDWKLDPATQAQASIEIDSDPPRTVLIVTSRQTVLLGIDEDLAKRLATASSVTWHLPWGKFRTEVDGFAVLRQELSDCIARRK